MYMCVYDTDTSAGTYSAFGPISLWAFTYFLERGVCSDHQVF